MAPRALNNEEINSALKMSLSSVHRGEVPRKLGVIVHSYLQVVDTFLVST